MNCVEARRVLKTLEDSVLGMKALAYINPDPWPSFALCQHEALTTALQVHRKALEAENNETVVLNSTLDLLRILKDPAALKELREVFATPRYTMIEFGDVFERLIVHIKQQLHTSVEEDKANASNFELIKHREEEAISEQKKLEQILNLERIERAKQLEDISEVEASIQASLDAVQAEFCTYKDTLLSEKTKRRDSDRAEYELLRTERSAKCETIKKELHEMQIRHQELEAELRQTRKRQMEDIEVAQQRFESELKKHEDELLKIQESYTALQDKTKKSNEQLESLIQERLVYENAQRKKKEEELMKKRKDFILNKAARLIQVTWRNFKKQKAGSKSKTSKKTKKG